MLAILAGLQTEISPWVLAINNIYDDARTYSTVPPQAKLPKMYRFL